MKVPLHIPAGATILLALAGCGEVRSGPGGSEAAGLSTRDSAGIRIIENADSTWTDQTRWRLTDLPDLVIGSVEGAEPGTDFASTAQVASVGDRIVVFDPRGQELRVFDGDGAFVEIFGGSGDGPTEFRSIGRIDGVDSTAIRASGFVSRRIVEFPLDGSEPRVLPLPPRDWNGGASQVAGWRHDDAFVLRTSYPRISDWRIEGEIGSIPDDWFLFSASGDSLAHLGSLPARRVYVRSGGSGPVMFSARAVEAVTDRALVYGFPHRAFEFRRIPFDGSAGSLVRLDVPAVPMPAGMEERYVAFEERRAREQGVSEAQFDQVRSRFEAMEVADTVPFFRDLLVAADGSVWLNHWPDPRTVPEDDLLNLDDIPSRDWTVVDSAGRWLGTVRMPEAFTPHEIGRDWVLGVRIAELDVPFVERYGIVR